MRSIKRKKQAGQSLLYVSILIVLLISGVFFVYDIGTIVNNKIKFQNGADAAALAAVATKISKHHNDTLMRSAMYNESLSAQAEQRAAQALLVNIILDMEKKLAEAPVIPNPTAPSIPGTLPPGQIGIPELPGQANPPPSVSDNHKKGAALYKTYVNKTYKHVIKLHRERKALEAYYDWLTGGRGGSINTGMGTEGVTEAARIGFRTNINALLTVAPENIRVLTDIKDVYDNQQIFSNIGGVAYGGEGATQKGNFGKTFIEFDGTGTHNIKTGASLLQYASRYTLTTNAAAKIVSSEDLSQPKAKLNAPMAGFIPGLNSVASLEMNWYSPRLMSITVRDFKKTIH